MTEMQKFLNFNTFLLFHFPTERYVNVYLEILFLHFKKLIL